jgi:hypothetical protein
VFWTLTKVPISKAAVVPKHRPGKILGSRIPSDIPTRVALIDRTRKATMARFKPTGTNSGSKKTYVMNPDSAAERRPEKYRG